VLVVGSARLAATLARAGHPVTGRAQADGDGSGDGAQGPLFTAPPGGLETYDALVLVQVVGRRDQPLQDLRRLVRAGRSGARVLLVEQAAWGPGGQWLGRLAGRIFGRPLVTDAAELASLCLNAGLRDVRQTWPQGLRSLVLTAGRIHPLSRALA
jgi:hypothetical protein